MNSVNQLIECAANQPVEKQPDEKRYFSWHARWKARVLYDNLLHSSRIVHYRGLLLIESVIEGSRFDDLDATERVQRK